MLALNHWVQVCTSASVWWLDSFGYQARNLGGSVNSGAPFLYGETMKKTDAQRRPITWRDLLAFVILMMLPVWAVFIVAIFINYDIDVYTALGLGVVTGTYITWGGMVVVFYFRKSGEKKPPEVK